MNNPTVRFLLEDLLKQVETNRINVRVKTIGDKVSYNFTLFLKINTESEAPDSERKN